MRWRNLLLKNQFGFDCQVVTAVNAYYCLTGKRITDKDEYRSLVELAKAMNGAAISIEKVHRKLGLKTLWEGNSLYDLQNKVTEWGDGTTKSPLIKKCTSTRIPLPMEWVVWHKKRGLHSTLIVDECSKTKCFRVVNFDQVTSHDGWFFKEDMYLYTKAFKPWHKGHAFRLFGLRGQPKLKVVSASEPPRRRRKNA